MSKNRPEWMGFLVGLAVTAVMTFACFFFADKQIDRFLYDVRMRHFNSIEASERIVHVDIDDGAVEEVGRWPWRRRRIAQLIQLTHELGAEFIMVDLLLSEEEGYYVEEDADPRLYRDGDIDPDQQMMGDAGALPVVAGDDELDRAIRNAGNVIMAVQLDAHAPNAPPPAADRLAKLNLNSTPTDAELLAAMGEKDSPTHRERARREWTRLRLTDALSRAFTLTPDELSKQLGIERSQIDRVIATAKQAAAADWVARVIEKNPSATLSDVRVAVFGDATARIGADDEDLRHAFRTHRGLKELGKHVIEAGQLSDGALHRATGAVPLLSPLGSSALDLAAVNFSADKDGIVRRVPPLVRYKGGIVQHMGVAAATRILDLNFSDASMPSDRLLVIPRSDVGEIEVPLDGNGNMLIPWTRTAPRWGVGDDFRHITAAALIAIADNRQVIAENEKRLLYTWADVVASVKSQFERTNPETGESEMVDGDFEYRKKVRELIHLRRRIESPTKSERTGNDFEKIEQRHDALVAEIDATQKSAAGTVAVFAVGIDDIPDGELAADEKLRADVERIRGGMQALETVNRLKSANAEIEREIAAGIARLRAELEGKYVFIGFAATAQGDIVSTAIDPRTNGVMCHANVLNAFLQNRFITPASSFVEWPMCLLAGALVGWWTAVRSPRFALTATLLLIVGAMALIFHVMFRRFDTWYVATQFAVVPAACWAAVTLFRQLTAERDKRLFRAQLSQYTSPAIAARIAESPEAAEAFKKVQTRDMTCYFSDLAGFTSISEREDAEIVQHVLNVYLERMSATIWARRGLINKFMGDGVMALFNPSVDPLDDHARVACEASLDTLEALDTLKREMADDPGASVFAQLSMRIGLAAGEVKNGDMGSELKADYTVIGDVVNLAARLEPANKVFGTNLLISGALRDRIGDDYDIRYLAELQVKGKDRTVPVYELIGRKGTMTDDERAYVERFEQGVALYRAQKWDECIVHFTRILARRPDDAGAARYIDACQELKAFPPGDDWNGALELKEK